MSQMANDWGANGCRVSLLAYDDGRTLPQYRLHRDVGYVPLGIARRSVNPIEAVVANLRRLVIIRKAIRRINPEAVKSDSESDPYAG